MAIIYIMAMLNNQRVNPSTSLTLGVDSGFTQHLGFGMPKTWRLTSLPHTRWAGPGRKAAKHTESRGKLKKSEMDME
jgi:hypothetical protein